MISTRTSLLELQKALSVASTVAAVHVAPTYAPEIDMTQEGLVEKLNDLIARIAKFSETWYRKRGDLNDDQSRYDLSLCSIAARAGWTESELAWLIREHRGNDKKSKRVDYIQGVVRKALEGVYCLSQILEMINAMNAEDTEELERINHIIWDSGLSKISQDKCHRALKRKTGVTLTVLRNAQKDYCDDFDTQVIVRRTIARIGNENIIYSMDTFWLWNTCGVWNRIDDRVIKKHIHAILDEDATEYSKGHVESILDLVKTECFKEGHQFDLQRDCINCLSGELYFVDGAWQIKPHNKNNYFRTQLPIEYDQHATAARFEQYLDEIFEYDSDAKEKATLLIELIGYTLLPDCKYEQFVMLIGSGSNGKSVLLHVIESLIGKNHVCAVQPSQLDNKFQRAHLQGKLANIITEVPEGSVIADAQLKALVSGELTTAEHKHKPPFDFHPYATCWFGTNHMPHTRDFSDALFRRANIIEFNKKFEGPRCNPRLKYELDEELPGILNLSLEALASVLEHDAFTVCPSDKEAKARWRLEADQAAQFVEDLCELHPEHETHSATLYNKYCNWVMDEGITKKLNRNNFTRRLMRLGVETSRGTGGIRLLSGIRIRK